MREVIVRYEDNGYGNVAGEIVEDLIRCKDCEYYGMEYGMDVCGLGGFSPEPDDFCSRGERRER